MRSACRTERRGGDLHGWSSRSQAADLDQVVGEDSVSGPGSGALDGVDPGAFPAVVALEVADSSLASGSPLDLAAEGSSSLVGLAGLAGLARAWDDHVANAQLTQVVLNAGVAVTAVGSDGAWRPIRAVADWLDGRGQAGRVGRVAERHVVVEHDAVLVVRDLRLVAELDWFAEPALTDRPRVWVVQTHSPG